MKRFVLSTVVLLLGGCLHGPADTPTFPDAPSLATAEPMMRDDDAGRTMLLSENKLDPDQLRRDLKPPTAGETAPASPLAALIGDYTYHAGRSSMNRAIDRKVGEFGVIARPIARKRLKAANKAPYSVAIHQDGDKVTVRLDNRKYTGTLDHGSKRVAGIDGTPSRMRFHMRNGSLYQTFEAAEGSRTNVFRPRDDGGMDMTVWIASDKLPSDLRYRLEFEAR
jgi:hypothetical protein